MKKYLGDFYAVDEKKYQIPVDGNKNYDYPNLPLLHGEPEQSTNVTGYYFQWCDGLQKKIKNFNLEYSDGNDKDVMEDMMKTIGFPADDLLKYVAIKISDAVKDPNHPEAVMRVQKLRKQNGIAISGMYEIISPTEGNDPRVPLAVAIDYKKDPRTGMYGVTYDGVRLYFKGMITDGDNKTMRCKLHIADAMTFVQSNHDSFLSKDDIDNINDSIDERAERQKRRLITYVKEHREEISAVVRKNEKMIEI